jgi:hypothetical protein
LGGADVMAARNSRSFDFTALAFSGPMRIRIF